MAGKDPKAEEQTTSAAKTTTKESPAAEPLPKLSPQDFRVYNHMAEHMDMFHNHFRQTWDILSTACETNARPRGMTMRRFLQLGDDFCRQLTAHHGIEERHIFPVLARRMPAFRDEGPRLLDQHREIHRGLDKLEEYLSACRAGERELRLPEMGDILKGFGGVLWAHLDDEVGQLGAENMRRYWSLEEMRGMPM